MEEHIQKLIVNYENLLFTILVIDSFKKHPKPNFEIIVTRNVINLLHRPWFSYV